VKHQAMDATTLHSVAQPDELVIAPDLSATAHRFLWHAETRTAVLADLHLGIEDAWIKQGLAIPGMLPAYVPALTRAWAKLSAQGPARVVIAGDLFDAAEPSESAVEYCRRLFRSLPAGCRIIITRGNHDPDAESLGGIFAGMPVSVCGQFRLGPHVISHGHEPASPGAGAWIVGHQHPAVEMRSRIHGRGIKMPCFAVLSGSGSPRTVLLPAFSHGPLGCNLLSENQWLLPLPRPEDRDFRIAGLIEPTDGRPAQVLDFGPLSVLA